MKCLRYLGWNRPFPELAAPQLLNTGYRYADTASVDLSRILVLVSGRGAGNALNRSMTELLAPFSGGVFPPEYMTPERFLLEGAPETQKTASEMEQLRAWKTVLSECDRTRFHTLFPVDFPRNSETVIRNLAKQFNLLKRELSAGCRTMASVRDSGLSADPERWEQIAELENRYTELLSQYNLIDPETMKMRLCESADAFRKYERIVAAGVPDASTILTRRLARAAELTDVEIWINAPDELESMFDEWGRPLNEKWMNYPLSFGPAQEIPKRMFKTDTFKQTAVLASALLTGSAGHDLTGTAIAIADESLFDPLRKELSKLRIKGTEGRTLIVTSPAGEPMKKLRLSDLLSRLGRFLSSDDFNFLFDLFRHEDILAKVSSELGLKQETILNLLDDFRLRHLPDTLSSALPLAREDALAILEYAAARKKEWLSQSPARTIRQFLGWLYAGHDSSVSAGIPLRNEIEAMEKQLRSMEASPLFSGDTIDTVLPELLDVCGNMRLYREPLDHEFSIGGFLELPWSDAKKIILCGMNDGFIPESITGSTFLPDTLRSKLELQCNARRRGRDILYLESLLRSRGPENLHFLASRYDASGKPLKFSSLFFQGTDPDVFDRASILFDATRFPENAGSGKGACGFSLAPDFRCVPERADLMISVTRFKQYLASPFRFFLANFMNMDEKKYDLQELDRGSFGTACHTALERVGRNGTVHPVELEKQLLEALDSHMLRTYGSPLPILVEIQKEQMKQRLSWAAKRLAESAAEFTVLECEYALGGAAKYVEFEGAKIRGRIDRIEYSPTQNVLRLIDYKTTDSGDAPQKVHYRPKANVFLDLQLPLYRLLIERDPAFRQRHPEIDFSTVRILCGYFNMPKNVTETGYVFWDGLDALLPGAHQLVRRIFDEIGEMRKGVFHENPDRKVKFDAFEFCLLPDLRSAVPSATWIEKEDAHE